MVNNSSNAVRSTYRHWRTMITGHRRAILPANNRLETPNISGLTGGRRLVILRLWSGSAIKPHNSGIGSKSNGHCHRAIAAIITRNPLV